MRRDTMANKISSQQNVQITGSTGVNIGSIEQKTLTEPETPETTEEAAPRKVKILFVAANPGDTDRLRLDREIKAIGEALRVGTARDLFDLEQTWAATPADLQDHLLRYAPQVVHFSGHGDDGALVLEHSLGYGNEGEHVSVTAQSIAELFSLVGNNVRCVVLNACNSAPLAEAIAGSIDCAIGMSEPVDDILAVLFSWSFYHALGSGQSIKSSFDLACTQTGMHEGDASRIPRLFARRVDPSGLFLFGDAAKHGRSGAVAQR
jgi:hypothetical protein